MEFRTIVDVYQNALVRWIPKGSKWGPLAGSKCRMRLDNTVIQLIHERIIRYQSTQPECAVSYCSPRLNNGWNNISDIQSITVVIRRNL